MVNKDTHYYFECKLKYVNKDTPYYLENVS